jgi:hypothetical protein
MHIHPVFALAGALCCYLLMLWTIPSAVFGALRRTKFSTLDGVMLFVCIFVGVVIVNSGQLKQI